MVLRIACLLLSLSLSATAANWARASQKPSQSAPGLKVGDKAPGFQLRDQNGRQRSLKGLLSEGKVALVFYRSASW